MTRSRLKDEMDFVSVGTFRIGRAQQQRPFTYRFAATLPQAEAIIRREPRNSKWHVIGRSGWLVGAFKGGGDR